MNEVDDEPNGYNYDWYNQHSQLLEKVSNVEEKLHSPVLCLDVSTKSIDDLENSVCGSVLMEVDEFESSSEAPNPHSSVADKQEERNHSNPETSTFINKDSTGPQTSNVTVRKIMKRTVKKKRLQSNLSRKKRRRESEWLDNNAKDKRAKGKEGIGRTGPIEAKVMGLGPHDEYYGLADKMEQWTCLSNWISVKTQSEQDQETIELAELFNKKKPRTYLEKGLSVTKMYKMYLQENNVCTTKSNEKETNIQQEERQEVNDDNHGEEEESDDEEENEEEEQALNMEEETNKDDESKKTRKP
ncbi:glutamic acid-rich protein-like [Copidosoma floridanum]|uniref:glutamic acid-rich protein-like n=1 Tax=Copidosoma floridanum TaxID=29053 RepID=UPI000C6F55A9|nr:glutamic acid-rich protein-like [Copidosoma floridanum]